MKQRHAIPTLVSLYTEWETHPLSFLKGDVLPITRVSLYLRNRRGVILTQVSLLSQKHAHLEY
jgi:hypothetical protein